MLAPALASLIFTLAGTGAAATAPPAGLAARADLLPNASVAPLPDGTFLIGDGSFVRHVDTHGMQHVIAGSGYEGTSGDGGPATAAHLTVSGLAALPGGGYLIADGDAGRVRMVDAGGVISTVAGGGRSRADGVPATQAQLGGPDAVAVAPGGGFVIGDGNGGVVRRVGPDGLIRTIAGNGETESEIPKLTGQPATSVPIDASDVAVEADGSVLIADAYASRVDRVSPSGAIGVAAADVSAYGVGALPDGRFLVADNGIAIDGANARIWRYGPDGSRALLAGTGRFVSSAPSGLEHRGDGGGARDANLGFLRDVKPAPDGGVLFTEGTDSLITDDIGARVRYLAPAQPGILAAAIVSDRDRVFTPGKPAKLSVTTSLPATLTVAGTSTAVVAGTTRLPLPALSARPHTVEVTATDGAGRGAVARARVFPRGYLPVETARLVAAGIAFSVLGAEQIQGDGVLRCRRAGARRVDCEMAAAGRRCQVRAAISFAAHRLRWGTLGCFESRRGYRRPRALRKGDWSCEDLDNSCPPALFGKLSDEAIVPKD